MLFTTYCWLGNSHWGWGAGCRGEEDGEILRKLQYEGMCPYSSSFPISLGCREPGERRWRRWRWRRGGEGRRGGKTVVRSSKGYLSIQYFITDRAIGPLSQIS